MDEYGYISAYRKGIADGSVVVGTWVRLLYDWIYSGLQSGLFYYNGKKADRAIRFIESFCRHNEGVLAPGLLKLALWQKAFLSLLYGIVDKDGRRQFTEVALFVGRKCGKTLLASAIMTYEAFVDGEYGSEIYCLAPRLDQTALVYRAFEHQIQKNAALAKRAKKRKTDWYIPLSNTSVKAIAFSEKKADGFNPMLTVADEMSSWPGLRGLRQYMVMTSGTGARKEPITLSISSGGYVDGGIYDSLYTRGTGVLNGTSKEMHLLPVFYMIDDPQKWDDLEELRKSIPGMDISVSREKIQNEFIAKAHADEHEKVEFLTKFCGLKQASTAAWLKAEDIERAYGKPIDLEKFRGATVLGGIDLSKTTDLTAAAIILEKDGEIYIVAHFWLPADRIDEAMARDNLPYDVYIKRGLLSLSGEKVIDYRDCYRWYSETLKRYSLYPYVTGYDKWSATYLVQEMSADGYKMDDVRQGFNLSPILKDFGALMAEGKVHIGDDDLLKAHFYGGALLTDRDKERVRLVKYAQTVHIDGLAAVIDAMTVRDKWWGEYKMTLSSANGIPVAEIDDTTEADLQAEIDAEYAAAEAELEAELKGVSV